jgi:two-component system sensor histidine kinase UhpB
MNTSDTPPMAAARRDGLIVIALSIGTVLLCTRFNISELLLSWTQPRERYQLDELPVVLLVIALCLVWFADRRRRDARREVDRRREAERRLADTLMENRRLTQLYLEVQEAERKAIARELHDELGQYRSAVKLDAISIRDRSDELHAPAGKLATDMLGNLERMHGAVIGMIRQLRPAGLDELGLAAALEHCVNEWRRRLPRTVIELYADAAIDRLNEPHRVAVYRLIQEALTNIARHSSATHVSIRMQESAMPAGDAPCMLLQVDDDGVGADLTRESRGLGLIGMRERAQALGGVLSVRSHPGAGFRLLAHIPVGGTT